MNGDQSVGPVKETETTKEYSRLLMNIEALEKLSSLLTERLAGYLGSERPKNDTATQNPENYSKFAQNLNNVNGKVTRVLLNLEDVLCRLEI